MTQPADTMQMDLPEAFVNAFQLAMKPSDRFSIVKDYFDVQRFDESHSVAGNSFYFVFGPDDQSYLVTTLDPPVSDGLVAMRFAIDGERTKSLTVAKFLNSGSKGRIAFLTPKWRTVPLPTMESQNLNRPQSHELQDANRTELNADAAGLDINKRDMILDMGAFTQLIDAAQRSTIVPGIQLIIQLRDCEFRLGRYQEAQNSLESVFTSFLASASQRLQRLRREDTDIASGRTKISPKDLQAKRIRDNMETQAIERTRTRFARVLDGLRLLLRADTSSDDTEPESRFVQ